MASSYPGSVSATQVGSYFVGQYYQILRQQPNLVHQFYSDSSSMIRVDGDSVETAQDVLQIHSIVSLLSFTSIEIKTINSLDSWDGGVIVMVSGSVKLKDITGRRKFVQTFFLAPQEKGYFVLNDIFHFVEEGVTYPNMIPVPSEIDNQPHVSASLAEPPASDYGLEEEAREYVNSVHIDDDPVDKYSLPEHQQQLHEDLETEIVVEETSAQEASPPIHNVVHTVQETPAALVEESFEEPPKKTYASILRVSKGQPVLSAAPQHVPQYTFKSAPPPSELNHVAQPAIQQSSPVSMYVPESGSEPADEGYGLEDEGEVTSVYVRNLPANVTEAEIDQEFKNFGRIKTDGIFIRVRKEIGVCYAFVEFEDIIGVQNALQASPIQLAGRQVYIEERRPNSGSAVRGGRRGRGRGSYQADAPRGRFGARNMGRGSNLDNSDYSRPRGDGYLQRSSR
ncbi:nuclear transport factor 2 isoform X2 [Vigna umbellata]|uniref:nuclear transport factor 2 isoform X2 n=1 Tax=Phaseolus angularis TaxID=3914 RepID=UPI00080A2D6D|nr:nuclear transport factor 2 isoform X2 [Vigna angularis]XP_047167130.1 nuclear transport factor 2 isoform X2 [Vigna umbellata]